MYIAQKIAKGKTEMAKSEIERRIQASTSMEKNFVKRVNFKEVPFSFSFSPKTEEMFANFRLSSEKTPGFEKRREMVKEVGKVRGKRGKGKGCE